MKVPGVAVERCPVKNVNIKNLMKSKHYYKVQTSQL